MAQSTIGAQAVAESFAGEMRSRLLRNLTALVGSQIAGGVLSVAIVALTTRMLGSEAYGTYGIFLMAASLASALGVNWIFNGIYKAAADDRAAGRMVGGVLGTGLAFAAFWIVLLSFAVLALGPQLEGLLGFTGFRLSLVPVYVTLLSLVTIANYMYQAMGDFSRYAILPNLERLAFLIVLVVAARFTESFTLTHLLACLLATQSVMALIAYMQLDWRRIGRLSVSESDLKRISSFSYPYILTNMVLAAGNWFDVYAVEHFLNRDLVGCFYLAVQFLTVSTQVIFIFNTLLTQMFIALVKEGREDTFKRFYAGQGPALIAGGTLFLMAGAGALQLSFPMVFKPEFAAALPVMLAFTLALQASLVYVICHPLLFARGLTMRISVLTFLPLVVTVPLALYLIPRSGLSGAGAVRIVGTELSALLALALAWHKELGSVFPVLGTFAAGQICLALFVWGEAPAYKVLAALGAAGLAAVLFIQRDKWRPAR